MPLASRHESLVKLSAGQIFTIPRTPRVAITCTDGEVWITEGGRCEDAIVKCGSSFKSQGRGTVVVYVFDPAGFQVRRLPGAIAQLMDLARTIMKWVLATSIDARPTRAGGLANSQS